MKIPSHVRADIYGSWLDAEGKLIELNLSEQTNDKRKRHFGTSPCTAVFGS